MTNHLKRVPAPKFWPVRGKKGQFVIKPNPGPHPIAKGLPLGLLLRDHLKIAPTLAEIKKILNAGQVLVDGKIRKDHRFVVGLFDMVHLPLNMTFYRLLADSRGKLGLLPVDQKEAGFKICKITGKKILPGGKFQFNLHDSRCLVENIPARVGDSLVIGLPDSKVRELLPLKEGAAVYLLEGKHGGDLGTLEKIAGSNAVYRREGRTIETSKKYLFVVGRDQPLISFREKERKVLPAKTRPESRSRTAAKSPKETGFPAPPPSSQSPPSADPQPANS